MVWAVGLGRIAAGDLEGGIADLERALATVESAGATLYRPWLWTHLAQALQERGAPGDAARATGLFAAAIDGARQLDAPVMVERIEAIRSRPVP